MERNSLNNMVVKLKELGPRYRTWREEAHISLEQASQLSGVGIYDILALENGLDCLYTDFLKYNDFIVEHVPNGEQLLEEYFNEVEARYSDEDFEYENFEDEEECDENEIKETN